MAKKQAVPPPLAEVLPPARVRSEWHARTLAEYRSCAVTHHLTLWLIQLGASPELITAGWRIASDELTHAELSCQVFVQAGGDSLREAGAQTKPHIERAELGLLRHDHEPLEHDILRACVEVFCLGETVAVPLFKELRQKTRIPVARRVLDRVLRDEVRHRDFGWTLLTWLLATPAGPALRELLAAELPAMLARLFDSYARPGDERETTISDAEQEWGLMPTATYGKVLQRALGHDYAPRFARLGIPFPPAGFSAGI